MKPKTAEQLLALMKAKTRIQKYAFEDAKRQSEEKFERADALRKAALSLPASEETSPADLMNAARFSGTRLAEARKARIEAANMTPLIEKRRRQIHQALKRELGMAGLSSRIETAARKAEAGAEEDRLESVRSLRVIASGD